MVIAKRMEPLVTGSSIIRKLFEEGKEMAKKVGAENVYDYSLGNPSVPAPDAVKSSIIKILDTEDPLFVHGYMSNTEPWRYGEKVEHIIARYLDLRYRLLPYIYSQNAAVSFNGSTLMRPLVMDFPEDRFALEQNYQFMFGPSILVAPVVESGVNRMKVYLPECSAGWVDFWNGTPHKGGIFTDDNYAINWKLSAILDKVLLAQSSFQTFSA